LKPEEFGQYKGWWYDTNEPIAAEDWAAYRAIKYGAVSINEKIIIEAFDGTRKTILNSAFPLQNSSQDIIGAVLLNQDVTRQFQLKDELDSVYEGMQSLMRQSPSALLVTDAGGRIRMANTFAEDLFGFSREELTGRSIGNLIPDWRKCPCVEAPQLSTKCDEEFTAVCKDQKVILTEMEVSDLRDENNNLLLFSIRDLRIWENLVKSIDDIIVSERRLRIQAEEAVRSRGQLLSEISHDLKNHIQAIAVNLALLKKGLAGGELGARARLVGATTAIKRMRMLLRDLLDTENMEGGFFSVKDRQKGVPISKIANDVVHEFDGLAAEKHISLNLEIENNLPPAYIDQSRVIRVFENLLGNAIKFSLEGGKIDVVNKPYKNFIECVVSDTGPGVDRKIAPFIFERFVVADTTDKYGVGLGLPIAKGIINAHGGSIWLQENKPSGASFHFTLPVAEELSPSQ